MVKKAKKTTKKSLKVVRPKNRKSNKKVVRKRKVAKKVIRRRTVVRPHNYYLHRAKQVIMNAVPVMPCSVINKDRTGRLYAHTQAEKVYNIYREKCELHGLVIRRIEGMCYETNRPSLRQIGEKWKTFDVPCVRYEGKWEVCHVASGETETFCGAGDGDNEIWSVNSAQTVAKKCGLLDYFEVAWPQPTDWLQTVRESMEELPPQELFKAIQGVIPKVIFEATKIGDLLTDYFNSVLKTHNERKPK